MVSLVWQNLVRSPHQSRQNIKSVKIWRRHIIEQQHQPPWSFYCRYVAFFSHTTSPIMKELRGGGGVETMNAYAPLDCPRPTCGRNFKSLPPPLQDHTTLSSLPIYSILDHECREEGGDSWRWLQVVWLWTIFPNLRKGISNGFPRIGPPVMYQ